MDLNQFLGLGEAEDTREAHERLQLYINLKLASSGQPTCMEGGNSDFLAVANDLLKSYREKSRLLSPYLCPPDRRIQDFLDSYLADVADGAARLPDNTLV
ncbi:MAG: hypothetical protein WC091_22210, partial [Sulfuricellaceae bacterium]